MAPKYFTDNVASAMDKHRTLRRQQVARQAGRGLTAGAMGAQGRVEEAQQFLQDTSREAIEDRRRKRFMEQTAELGKNVDRAATRENAIREDERARDQAVLDAEMAKLRAELEAATASAGFRNDRDRRNFEREMADYNRVYNEVNFGLPSTREARRSREEDADAQAEGLSLTLSGADANSVAVTNANGSIIGTIPNNVPTVQIVEDMLNLYTASRADPAEGAVILTGFRPGDAFDSALTGSGQTGGTSSPLDDVDVQRAAIGIMLDVYTRSLPNQSVSEARQALLEHPQAQVELQAVADRLGVPMPEGEELANLVNNTPRVGMAVQNPEAFQGLASLTASFGALAQDTQALSGRGGRRVNVTTEQYGAYVNMTDEQLATAGLPPEAIDRIQATRESQDDAILGQLQQAFMQHGRDPGTFAAQATLLLEGVAPERANRLFDAAAREAQSSLTLAQVQDQAGTHNRIRLQEADASLTRATQVAASVGVDTSGVQAAQERVNQGREPERRTYADALEFSEDPEIQELARQADEGDVSAARELEERLSLIEETGTTLVMGIEVPNHMIPQPGDVQGEIELMSYLMTNYPQHPTLAESRRAMMASPEFEAWRESRGYGDGIATDWHWREFNREYRIAARMNLAKSKAQKRANRRAGVIMDEEDMPDMPSDESKLYRRDARKYRRDLRGAVREHSRPGKRDSLDRIFSEYDKEERRSEREPKTGPTLPERLRARAEAQQQRMAARAGKRMTRAAGKADRREARTESEPQRREAREEARRRRGKGLTYEG